jgi:hypothetical protein
MALATPGSNPFSKTSMAVRCRRARVRRAASAYFVTWVRRFHSCHSIPLSPLARESRLSTAQAVRRLRAGPWPLMSQKEHRANVPSLVATTTSERYKRTVQAKGV